MNYLNLKRIKKKYFSYREISKALGITLESARVAASRFVKSELLVRAKRDIYCLRDDWERFERQDKFILANLIQTPSYVSLMSAMDYYEVTTQMQRDYIESVALQRAKSVEIEGTVFNYIKISKNLYSGFLKEKGFFIALPEKAFLDAIYLKSLKRYDFDITSIDFTKFDRLRLKKMLKAFPANTKRLLEEYGYPNKA